MIELSNSECKECVYKFVCLGGCPLGARAKGEEMTCVIFEDEEILDNLEFDYSIILRHRSQKEIYETEKNEVNTNIHEIKKCREGFL